MLRKKNILFLTIVKASQIFVGLWKTKKGRELKNGINVVFTTNLYKCANMLIREELSGEDLNGECGWNYVINWTLGKRI